MKTVIHKADTRGKADHGWLKSSFSFSFADYYNTERMGFGALRVLNDDWIAGGKGFGMHPHDNMEIISIPLSGKLEHCDDMGNQLVIGPGDVQTMSAGSGVVHSEMNASKDTPGEFLQIWITSKEQDVEPSHGHSFFSEAKHQEKFALLVSPYGTNGGGLPIHQDAYISRGSFTDTESVDYALKGRGNGAYVFIISGSVLIDGRILRPRDAIGVFGTRKFSIHIQSPTDILIIEVPMGE